MDTILRFGTSTAIACVFTIRVVAAQTPPAPYQTPLSDPDRLTAMTVTGCLQRNTPEGLAGVGTNGSATPATKFILTNAKAATGSRTSPVGTATPDQASETSTIRTYRLDAEDSRLAPEVGHQVEISGTLEKRGGSGVQASKPATSVPAAPRLTVISVKVIAAACGQ